VGRVHLCSVMLQGRCCLVSDTANGAHVCTEQCKKREYHAHTDLHRTVEVPTVSLSEAHPNDAILDLYCIQPLLYPSPPPPTPHLHSPTPIHSTLILGTKIDFLRHTSSEGHMLQPPSLVGPLSRMRVLGPYALLRKQALLVADTMFSTWGSAAVSRFLA
jgi:hypothetical protein